MDWINRSAALVWILSLSLCSSSCNNSKTLTTSNETAIPTLSFTAGPSVMVYKTKKDYTKHVPVILSEDKTKIISYPAPDDVRDGANYRTPIALTDGYFLDKKGIGKNVAFLKLTYEAYAALAKAPSKAELMSMIVDNDPLVELCNCGNKSAFTNEEEQLNALITSGKLRKDCKVIK